MTNRVAIVSGGAGGIGSVISARLGDLGYNVVIADTSEENAQRVKNALATERGQKHSTVIGDLTLDEVNKEAAARAAAMGTLTTLVNAVGISPKRNGEKINFYEIDTELWDTIMAVNVKAPFLLIREAYSYMPTDGTASIVNLLSITAKLGSGGLSTDTFSPVLPSAAAYAASKAALQNLTATLSHELSSFNIRVNGVAPGLVSTNMTDAVSDKEGMAAQLPMGRFGTPQEVTDAIEFLIGDKSTYITGTSIDINGGWYTC